MNRTPSTVAALASSAGTVYPSSRFPGPLFSPDGDGAGGNGPPLPPGGGTGTRGDEAAKGATGGDGEMKTQLTKAQSDLVAAQAKVKELEGQGVENEDLRKAFKDVRAIVRGEGTDAEKESATRRTMARVGYTNAEIDSYLKKQGVEPTPKGGKGGRAEDGEGEDGDGELRRSIQDLDQRTRRLQYDDIVATMSKALQGVDSHPEVGTLVAEVRKAHGDEAAKNLAEILREQAESAAKVSLASRWKASGLSEIPKEWIVEEVTKALPGLIRKHRSVMPNLSKLGKGETGGGEDSAFAAFLDEKAPEPPSYKPGMSLSDAEEQLGAYTRDTLRRGAAAAEKTVGSRA